jgi:hypothetical protein
MSRFKFDDPIYDRPAEQKARRIAQTHPAKNCVICGSIYLASKHHLIPKAIIQKWYGDGRPDGFQAVKVWLCRWCHDFVHWNFSNATLAEECGTVEKLLRHPKIAAVRRVLELGLVPDKETQKFRVTQRVDGMRVTIFVRGPYRRAIYNPSSVQGQTTSK